MRLRHCLFLLDSFMGLLMLSPLTLVHGETSSPTPTPTPDGVQVSIVKDASSDAGKPDANKNVDEAKVDEANEAVIAPAPLPTPLQLEHADKSYESAYVDTYHILSEENSCSRFYGGSHMAVTVFNQFVGRLRTEYDRDSKVGITMTTPVTTVEEFKTGYKYRLFAQAKLNSNGPFYKNRVSLTEKMIPGIGAFQANTREARSLMLLHELGHLMKGPDQQWLLQDDGNDPLLSLRNTKTIEAHCAKQIKELGDKLNVTKFMAGKLSGGR